MLKKNIKKKPHTKPLRILLWVVGITASILVMLSLDGGLQPLHLEREEVSKVISRRMNHGELWSLQSLRIWICWWSI